MLSERNLIDAVDCVNRSCLNCSMLHDTKNCLSTCIAIVAGTALELLVENKSLKEQLEEVNKKRGSEEYEQSCTNG